MTMNGIVNLYKPAGVGSRRAVDRVRHELGFVKAGHGGTLDRLAEGVLLVLLGRATRLFETIRTWHKRYEARIRLGATSVTDDAEGPIEPQENVQPVAKERIATLLDEFLGTISQVPPSASAVHVSGRRAHHLLREGEKPLLSPRRVLVYDLQILDYHWPDLTLTVECGGGFYLRSLARDLGERLGTGGYLSALRRTRIGSFDLRDSLSYDDLSPEILKKHLENRVQSSIIPPVQRGGGNQQSLFIPGGEP